MDVFLFNKCVLLGAIALLNMVMRDRLTYYSDSAERFYFVQLYKEIIKLY